MTNTDIYIILPCGTNNMSVICSSIENTSWKVLAYGIYARVVDVSEIERVSAANEFFCCILAVQGAWCDAPRP